MVASVVETKYVGKHVVQVTMQDKVHKNTFSSELIYDLTEAFHAIDNDSNIRAVILTGYDSYFASGGTKEELNLLQEGKMQFTDIGIYRLPLDCKVPVIAAMQGHGIGGGLVMGMFCDFILLSQESVYSANFMKYGFTPGMGATYILPQKMGFSLGQEMLMNAARYRGGDLASRGVSFPVLPRKEVLNRALVLANELSEKPRNSLVTLKDHLVSSIRKDLLGIIEKEVIMHNITFGQDEVKEKISALFGT